MAKFEDNLSPYLTVVEQGSTPANPSSGDQKLFVRTSDHLLCRVNSSGTVTPVGGGIADQGAFTYLDGTDAAAPGNPSAGYHRLYSKTDGLYYRDSSGTEVGPLAAAGGGGGGGGLLGVVTYSKGADTAWAATTSTSDADIDATNASLAITVPASGKILVSIQVAYVNTVAAQTFYLTVRTGSTTLGSALHVGGFAPPNAGSYMDTHPMQIYITGLTPGALTIKAGFHLGVASGTCTVYANDGAGGTGHVYSPFVMAAWAA